MTLELNQVAPQVKAMGQSLVDQQPSRTEALQKAQTLLKQYATRFDELEARLKQAEKVQQSLRFDWVGAAPTGEALTKAHPLPACPDQLTVIASDGSQILPDQHAIFPYYLINIGSIIYRHGSNTKPETHNPAPILCYEPFDEQGRLTSTAEINVQRDLAELKVLLDRIRYLDNPTEPTVTLMDGQLTLRVIDLPFNQQEQCQKEYIDMLDQLRRHKAVLASYIDRPRSSFVLALMQLASLKPEAITEETLRQNPFRHLTDLELFDFLPPGQRSALFAIRAKGIEQYEYRGHTPHFFYLNVGKSEADSALARVEIPAWITADEQALDTLHAIIVRQARITGGYPYVLARADELAVISGEERQAGEMMLAVEMRRQGLIPQLSPKQRHKNAFRFSRRF